MPETVHLLAEILGVNSQNTGRRMGLSQMQTRDTVPRLEITCKPHYDLKRTFVSIMMHIAGF
jgi:hypothetical protein